VVIAELAGPAVTAATADEQGGPTPFASFVGIARAELLRRVWPLHAPNDVGVVCTVGVQLATHKQSLVLSTDGRFAVLPRAGDDAAPCALVHQYERAVLPMMLADVHYRVTGRSSSEFRFCETGPPEPDGAGGSVTPPTQCWTYDRLRRGEPPTEDEL
jgi:hypothetical protein